MAAGANPNGNHQGINGVSAANGNSDNSGMAHVPTPGISTDWTAEEHSILEEGLSKYSGLPPVMRYAKVAQNLPDKTVRDVALRCRYMNKKEVSKRRKDEPSRKSKEKKEKVSEPSSKPSHLPSQPSSHPYSMPTIPMDDDDDDDGVSYKAIGGPIGELLEQNVQAFQKIRTNFSLYQFQENMNLFCQARNNIVKILNSVNDTPEVMKQMPPLPVKLNDELANSILPNTSHSMQ